MNARIVTVFILVIGCFPTFANDITTPVILTSGNSSISNIDFRKYYLSLYPSCPQAVKKICEGRNIQDDFCPDGIRLNITYGGVADSPPIAIVNGSTCETGTAGPDIHDIYALRNGKLLKLDLPIPEKNSTGKLFGNQNYNLSWEDNHLVEKHSDTSGRENPLTIRYVWKDGTFHISSIETAPMYKTSYNCSTAKEEHEQAICYEEELAELDLKLDKLYKEHLAQLSGEPRRSLINDQRNWIIQRNKNCVIYKWWFSCLQKEYNQRMSTLDSMKP